jgi:hypothetical protein
MELTCSQKIIFFYGLLLMQVSLQRSVNMMVTKLAKIVPVSYDINKKCSKASPGIAASVQNL